MKLVTHLRVLFATALVIGLGTTLAAAPPSQGVGPEVGKLVPPLTTVTDVFAGSFRKLASME